MGFVRNSGDSNNKHISAVFFTCSGFKYCAFLWGGLNYLFGSLLWLAKDFKSIFVGAAEILDLSPGWLMAHFFSVGYYIVCSVYTVTDLTENFNWSLGDTK